MDILLHLRRTVAVYPHAPALMDGQTHLNWSQFDERSRRMASALAQLGLKKGERVAVLMNNGFRYFEAFYFLVRMGAIIVPLNTRFAPAELAYVLNDCEAAGLIVEETYNPVVEKLLPDLARKPTIIYARTESISGEKLSYESLIASSAEWKAWVDLEPAEEDLAVLMYTGGTTGKSKGVMLTHRNLASNSLHSAIHLQARPHHVYLHAAPMFHIADAQSIFTFTLVGASHTFLAKFDPVQMLEVTQRERVTHLCFVPTMINLLLQVPTIQNYDLSSLELIQFGGSPTPLEVLKRAREILPCRLMQGYGMTEAAPGLTLMEWEDVLKGLDAPAGSPEARRLLSCGQPMVDVDVRVVNDEDKKVSPGEIGEVIVRGPNVMKGYWNLPTETATALRDGWFYTGDLAMMDEANFLFITDRKKDMIISGAENIYSAEVENALYSHPAVLEAAVIGVPDPRWGERVHAVIVLKPGHAATEEEIVAKCRQLIAGYKIPRSMEFVEVLPKSGAGKILKRLLRDKYWEGQPRQVS